MEKGMKKHVNIPVFVPHIGCPNDCVFCNQHTISGKTVFRAESVKDEIDEALMTIKSGVPQIAFFGGSFTGIELPLMLQLLKIARTYVDKGLVDSVRISTRPDYINESILQILKEYRVKSIELGIQSMNDRVLELNRRGHNADTSRRAMETIAESGFELTGQMMIGMYGSSGENEIETATEISKFASSARIYPTVTFKGTALAELFANGQYKPLTLDQTVERGAAAAKIFIANGVDIIRIGLQSAENLHSTEVLAGDYRDAIGEMILSRIHLDTLRQEANRLTPENGELTFLVPQGLLSQYIGQKRRNIEILEKELGLKIKIKETPK